VPADVCRGGGKPFFFPWENSPVTWIKIVPFDKAEGELKRCYEAVYALYPPEYMSEVPAVQQADGSADSITAAHSLIPAALRHSLSTYGVLLDPNLPLSRRQHEMIATVVSVLNRCFY
jgi:hypothetical protein